MSLWRLRYKRHCSFYVGCSLSLRSLSLGETNCHVVNSLMGKPTWQETEASCQQPARHGGLQKTATWMNLEVDTDDCSLRDIWSARTPQLRYSWIPDSLKIINVCCFKVLNLGVPFMQQQITRTTFCGENKGKHPICEGQGWVRGEGTAGDQARQGTGDRSHATFSASSEEFELNPEKSWQPVKGLKQREAYGQQINWKKPSVTEELSFTWEVQERWRHILCLQRLNILELCE